MPLIEFTELNKQTYQSFAKASGAFLQDWEWGELKSAEGEKVLRFGFEQEGLMQICGQAILNETLGVKFLQFPQGPLYRSSTDFSKYLPEFAHLLGEKIKGLSFIRIEPVDKCALSGSKPGINLNPHKTLILSLQNTVEQLLAGMKQKTRYNIKIAEKAGISIKTGEALNEAVDLIIHASVRAGVRAFSKKYYLELLSHFAPQRKLDIEAQIYTAWHDGDLLAANLMLFRKDFSGGRVIYLFGGSSDEKRNLMAPYLLHWQAIQDAKNAGYAKYDFWGIEEDPKHPWYGFSRFKLGFGGEVAEYAGTLDYILRPAWYNMYTLLRKLNRTLRKW